LSTLHVMQRGMGNLHLVGGAPAALFVTFAR